VTGLVRSRLDDSLVLVEQTTERIRDVMAELRPPVLDDYGLVAALHWYG
jgi:two-component system sensor histidine kinase UhpB